MSEAHAYRLLLTPEEAAERLSLSRTTVYELVRKGRLQSVKIGRARRIPRAALQEYVETLVGSQGVDR